MKERGKVGAPAITCQHCAQGLALLALDANGAAVSEGPTTIGHAVDDSWWPCPIAPQPSKGAETTARAGAVLWSEILKCLRADGDIEYYDLVKIAVDAGLIREEEYDPAVHGKEGYDADPGDCIWFLTPVGMALRDAAG